MMTVRLTTWVNAPIERCFLLATSRELTSVVQSQSGVWRAGEGALQQGDVISWQLAVMTVKFSYMSRIEGMRPYSYFKETMVAGIFRHFEHEHHFARMDDGTRVRDEIRFELRYGLLGRLLGATVLRTALMKMLGGRISRLKRIAESGEWQRYLESEERIVEGTPGRTPDVQQFVQG